MNKKNHLYHFILCLLLLFASKLGYSQPPSLIEYGQNRVQYKDFNWQFYETDNFKIYFYQGGQDIGKYVVLNAEKLLEEMSQTLDFRFSRKLDVIVYNDISDLRQSNIGLAGNQTIENGQVKLLDNKLFIYFNGSHRHIDQQIKEGISKIFIGKYVTGSGLKETVRNSVRSSLPRWYTNGMTAFNTYAWNTKFENKLKDGILSGRYQDLSKLSEQEMSFVGHSIWAYINEKYGKDALANLTYLVKINKNLDRGFSYVTGKRFNDFLQEWYFFYVERFKLEMKRFDALPLDNFVDIPLKKNHVLYGAKLNAKADHIAYMTNEDGKWRVHVYHLEEKKDKVVFKGWFRTNTVKTDLKNPMIAWDPRGRKLTIIYEIRDQYFIRHYNLEQEKLEEETPIRKFQNIFDFSYAEDSKNLILSAMKKGQVDIYKYYLPSTKVSQITNDFYDDLQPSYIEVENHKGYLFISNRPNNVLQKQKLDSILPNGTFDVFFYDIENEEQRLVQVSNTPNANESYPMAYNNESFSFLSDANGVNNRYVGHFEQQRAEDKIKYEFNTKEYPTQVDSIVLGVNEKLDSNMIFGRSLNEIVNQEKIPFYETIGVSVLNSNYNNSIAEWSSSNKAKKQLEQLLFKQKQRLLITDYSSLKNNKQFNTEYIKSIDQKRIQNEKIETEREEKSKIKVDNKENSAVFQSKFDDWKNSSDESGYLQMLVAKESDTEETGRAFSFSRKRQYFIKLKVDDVNVSLDNKLLITPYQRFNPLNPVYNNNGISGFIRLGVKDLFENHRIHGGFRLSDRSIVPREFYITYENLTKRLDYELTYYRNDVGRDISTIGADRLIRVGTEVQLTNYGHVKFKYALDILNSMRLKVAYRNERTSFKSTGDIPLNAQTLINNWGIMKLEFIHDHTIKLRANTLQGFRANGYVEFQKEFPGKDVTVFGENLNLPSWNNGYMITWGADVRHYQKVYKTITWANRLAFASSLGTRKVVYYLGGSDGQLFPGVDRRNNISSDQNYAFQSLAQQMRGFPQNTRNGNSYLVLNSELRVPIFSAFSKTSKRSKFIESIELVTFFDIGTAWEGITPWSGDNIYTEIRYNTPNATDQATAIVELNIYKDPIVFAFGPGLRAELFGYFLKFDLGWGYDTGEILSPKMHVSMSYDF